MFLSKLRIGYRIGGAFATVLALMLFVVIVTFLSMGEVETGFDHVRTESLPFVIAADEMVLNIVQVRQMFSDAAMSHDTAGIKESESSARKVEAKIATLRKMLESEDNKEALDKLRKIEEGFNKFLEIGKEMVEAYVAAAYLIDDTYLSEELMNDFQKMSDALMSDIEAFRNERIESANAIIGDTLDSISFVKKVMVLMTVGAIVLSLILTTILLRSIVIPIKNVMRFSEKLADGYLDERLSSNGDDEISQMISSLDGMASRLRDVMTNINIVVSNLDSSSHELNASAQELSQGAGEQASATEEASASIEEMASNIRQNHDNARETEKVSQQAAVNARQGGETVNEAVNAMKQIANKISIIDEIARQTNLLALNAAIEAARAGEHGKGFAVVAAEVRKLAERSQNAAAEVSELSYSSVGVSEKAGKVLSTLVPEIERTSELFLEISTASSEMNSGADQINKSISQVDSIAQTMSSASEAIASSSDDLASQSELLRETIGFFHLGREVAKRGNGGDGGANINFAQIRFKHLQWKSRLRDFLDGKSALTEEQAVSHKDCDLGKWYYAEGLANFGHIKEMQELDGIHADLHRVVKDIVVLKNSGNSAKAEQEFEKIGPISQEIIGLLNEIEKQV
jgi:methyl-accepting chemotaxis protein